MRDILLIFLGFLVFGVLVNYVLFYREREHKSNTRFLFSERLLVFVIEIVIAVIGFGITLAITNANEQQLEKDKAIHMLEQTIEYTDVQIERERAYLKDHSKGNIETRILLNSDVVSIDYYRNILSNEVILQNANMKTYGELMRYLSWMQQCDDRAHAAGADDETIYNNLYWRCAYLKKVRDFLWVCYSELIGELTAEEAANWCKEIKNAEVNGYDVMTPAMAP